MEKVIQKILEEARGKAEEIEKKAMQEAEKILLSAKKRVFEIEETARREAEALGKREKERLLALARVEMRRSALEKKRNLIEEVMEKALDPLLHEKDYEGWMMGLLVHSVEIGDEEVLLGKEENVIDRRTIQKVNERIKRNGKMGNLHLSTERGEFRGGFVLRRGRVEINATLDALLEGIRDELEVEISKILFQ